MKKFIETGVGCDGRAGVIILNGQFYGSITSEVVVTKCFHLFVYMA